MRMVCALVCLLGCDASGEDVVATDKGEVQGVLDVGTRRFAGVPFAAPPLGALRFASPTAHAAWGRLATKEFKSACMQKFSPITEFTDFSEDCLYLNVFTPRPAPKKAPVMVWIHGGGFILGSASEPMYDGTQLAKLGVIVVTVNYRLGPFGYVVYDQLSGNQGIEDQRAALQWVQKNIAAFGGDPKNVTLFGESAGAISTYIHMADPASAGLFQRAIVESGFADIPSAFHFPTDQEALDQGKSLVAALGCSTLDCAQQKDASAVLNALPLRALEFGTGMGVLWNPRVKAPYVALSSGSFNQVPVMLGTNGDEGTLFTTLGGPTTDAEYQTLIQAQFGTDAPAVIAQYPSSAYSSPSLAAAAVFGDSVFVSDARRTARALVAKVPAWRYSFERVPQFTPYPGLGAHHAAEIRFVFGSKFLGNSLTADEEVLGAVMRDHWIRFARDGKPADSWPAYAAATDPYLQFADAANAKMGLKTAQSDFWDSLRK